MTGGEREAIEAELALYRDPENPPPPFMAAAVERRKEKLRQRLAELDAAKK